MFNPLAEKLGRLLATACVAVVVVLGGCKESQNGSAQTSQALQRAPNRGGNVYTFTLDKPEDEGVLRDLGQKFARELGNSKRTTIVFLLENELRPTEPIGEYVPIAYASYDIWPDEHLFRITGTSPKEAIWLADRVSLRPNEKLKGLWVDDLGSFFLVALITDGADLYLYRSGQRFKLEKMQNGSSEFYRSVQMEDEKGTLYRASSYGRKGIRLLPTNKLEYYDLEDNGDFPKFPQRIGRPWTPPVQK